ncbi:SDR family NAD(P)-dependent oxidoreductase [Sulfurimonas hydrogeniphila]|uniref:SDR family NAD(P)-dependent oxidoreductase n=1 Tax=Sulfurimonas TaxID=202746 RepID=UPI00125FA2F7|nr:SDR family NAD(P)-dependent oxidoreductase [Sulfurimonas hydrogeniphila]
MKILITGASSGLGAEFARQYANKDTELILLARREQKLQSLQKELAPKCKSITLLVVDVTDFVQLQKKVRSVGAVDLLLLNAGISLGHTQTIPTIHDFQNLYNVNVLANHAILEVLLPQLQAQKSGHIVFVSSLSSLFTMPSAKVYASSKRALNAYAEGIFYKYAKDGLHVSILLPGFVKSEMTDKNEFKMPFLLDTAEGVKRMKKAIEKRKKFYAFPLRFYLIIRFMNLLPSALSQRIVNYLS